MIVGGRIWIGVVVVGQVGRVWVMLCEYAIVVVIVSSFYLFIRFASLSCLCVIVIDYFMKKSLSCQLY